MSEFDEYSIASSPGCASVCGHHRSFQVQDGKGSAASMSSLRQPEKVEMKNMSPRLSLLHVIAPGPVGGGERVVQALAIGLRQLGHSVGVAAVINAGGDDHPFVRPLLEANVEVHPLFVPPKAYVRERGLIRDLCSRLRPDAVHTHGDRADVIDAVVARRMGIATITTLHGASRFTGRARIYNWLQRTVLPKFDAVVAVSRPLADAAVRGGVPKDRVHLLPNAWTGSSAYLDRDVARCTLGLSRDGFVAGWVGRLIKVKGTDVFLKSLAMLTDLPLSAVIVGDGPERDALESQAASLGLRERVRFVGQIDNAARLFSAFDLFVLSSKSEGTPLTLLEAMASDVPIVASCVGGVPDVLSETEGRLVPPGDPMALSQAIRAVYSDLADAEQRAARARRRLDSDFAIEPWLSRYEDIYRRIQYLPGRVYNRGGA